MGRFALDFVVVRNDSGAWEGYAIELNLRKGGTTHPFLTLQFLTDGRYDPEAGVFTAPGGQPKCFVATDHLESPLYRAFTPEDLLDVMVRRGLHFHPAGYEIMYQEVTKLIAELWPDQVAEKLPTVLPLWNDAAAWSS